MDTFGDDNSNSRDAITPLKGRDSFEPVPQQSGMPEANKAELLEIFWRGRWIIVAAVVVAIGSAILYLQKTTPLYSASSQIYVAQSGPQLIKGDQQSAPQSAYYLATQVEVIKSVSILSIAVEQGKLKSLKSFEASENAVGTLKGGLTVELGKMNDIITVSYECPSPEDAAQAVNAVVDAYKTYNDSQRRSTAAEVLRILDHEYRDREAERNEKMNQMVGYRKDNSDVELDDHGDAHGGVELQQLSGLTQALTTAQLSEADARASYELAKTAVADPQKLHQLIAVQQLLQSGAQSEAAIRGVTNPDEEALTAQLSVVQGQLDDLSSRLLPDHPDIKFLQSKVTRLKQQLAMAQAANGSVAGQMTENQRRFADNYLAQAQQKWNLARIKVQSLQDAFGKTLEEQRQKAINGNNKSATYALLAADFHRAEALCDQLDNRMKEVHISEESGPMNVTILEVGRPSMIPSKPQKSKTLGIALVLGLTLGLGLAFLNGWMDQRFRSAEDVSGSLALPILGAVPQISGRESIQARGQKAHLQPISDFAEACRAIRTAIYFGMPDSQAKTMLVTSPLPGDGKSTAASNLAIVMAQAGQKTLVLDADFRRPNQHRIFQVDAKIGVTTVLAGKATLADAIKHSEIKGIDVLPCGPTPSHPAEILNSQAFADLLQELGQKYDHIVVDSPPIMPVTDARILGAICDGTVFVVRAEKSTRKVSLFARDVLQSVGTNILGVMINGLSRGRGYYDAGYYQYGYGGHKSRSASEKAASVQAAAIEPASDPLTATRDAH